MSLTRQLLLDAVTHARDNTPTLMRPSANAAVAALRKYVAAKGPGVMTPQEAMAIYTQLPSFFLLAQPQLRVFRTTQPGPQDLSILTNQGFTSWYWVLANFVDGARGAGRNGTGNTIGIVVILLQLSLDASKSQSLWQIIGGVTANTPAATWLDLPRVTLGDDAVVVSKDAVTVTSDAVRLSVNVTQSGFTMALQYPGSQFAATVSAASARGPTFQQPDSNATVAPGGVQSVYWSIVDGVTQPAATSVTYGSLSRDSLPAAAAANSYGAAWLDYEQLGMRKPIPALTSFFAALKPRGASAQWLWSCIQTPDAQFALAVSDPAQRSQLMKGRPVRVGSLNVWRKGQPAVFNQDATVQLLDTYPDTTIPRAIVVTVPSLNVVIDVVSYVDPATPASIVSDVIRAYESPSRVTLTSAQTGVAPVSGFGVIEWNLNTALPNYSAEMTVAIPNIKRSYAPSPYAVLIIVALVLLLLGVIVAVVLGGVYGERAARRRHMAAYGMPPSR